jgi:hypothetical protein
MGSPMLMKALHDRAKRILFAVVDVDNEAGLSLGEIATIRACIFEVVNADIDGTVSAEQLQSFPYE